MKSLKQEILEINELVIEFHRDRFQEHIDKNWERINRYVDSCPRPLANGGFKDTVTGDFIEDDSDV